MVEERMSETKRPAAPEGQPSSDLSLYEREAFIREKIEGALAESRHRSRMIPAAQVWRELDLEP